MIDLKLSYLKGTSTIPLFPDEYTRDEPAERELILEYESSKNGIFLVAEHEGLLIGNIDITGNQRRKLFHTAMLGMGNRYDWQNQGIGTALIESALEWARNNSPLEIIWLEVYASNDLGLGLYKKTGFKICGRMPNFFKEKGKFVEKISMVKYL